MILRSTFIECGGCRHYLGQAPNEPFCAHPNSNEPNFNDIPIAQCREPATRKDGGTVSKAKPESVKGSK